MKKLKYFLVLSVFLFFAASGIANAQATNQNTGVVYPTIQAAINAASAGHTINVAAGIYHEQISILKPLTINGMDGAVLDGSTLAGSTTAVKIKSGNVTFNNIDATNYTQDGIIIGYESSSPGSLQNVHVTNCTISNIQPGNHGFGIYAGYQSEDFKRPYGSPRLTAHLDYSGLLIEGNEIFNTDSSAVVLQSITGTPGTLVVRNNYIHDGENDGIWIDCARNIVVEGNVVTNNMDGFYISSYADNYVANPSSGWIYEDPWLPHLNGPYSPQNIVIRGNTISDNTTYGGIYLESGHPSTIFINDNNITGNTPGVANYLTEDVDATGNWWGDKTGPYHPTLNPKGTGDEVSDYVIFDPWLNGRAFFEVEEAKVDFKKKPDDDKIRVRGSLAIKPGSDGVLETEPVIVTIGPFASDPLFMDVKGKGGVWEYDRPKGETGIKKMTIHWKGTKAEFDIHVDKLEDLGWGNPVTVTIQIGDDTWSQTILMDVKKDKWEYHK